MTHKLVPMSQFSFHLLQKLGELGGLGQMQAFQYEPNTTHLPCMDIPLSFIAFDSSICQLVPATLSVGSFNTVLSVCEKLTCHEVQGTFSPSKESLGHSSAWCPRVPKVSPATLLSSAASSSFPAELKQEVSPIWCFSHASHPP